MDFFGWAAKGGLVRESVDPGIDLTLVKEHGQAILGAYTCPVKVVK